MTRPRKGQRWQHADSGEVVEVVARRGGNPMGSVRPHSDMHWSMVLWTSLDGQRGGIAHESEFREEFVFLGVHHE